MPPRRPASLLFMSVPGDRTRDQGQKDIRFALRVSRKDRNDDFVLCLVHLAIKSAQVDSAENP